MNSASGPTESPRRRSASGSSYGTSSTRLASERGDRSLWGLGGVGVRLGGLAEGGEVALGVQCGRAPGAGGGDGLAVGVVHGVPAREHPREGRGRGWRGDEDRKSTRLNSSHV